MLLARSDVVNVRRNGHRWLDPMIIDEYRHIGAVQCIFKLVMRPAKMNFAVADLLRGGRKCFIVRANEKLIAVGEIELPGRRATDFA
jgi:hypothetical protein